MPAEACVTLKPAMSYQFRSQVPDAAGADLHFDGVFGRVLAARQPKVELLGAAVAIE
jgi:hypothetical protein